MTRQMVTRQLAAIAAIAVLVVGCSGAASPSGLLGATISPSPSRSPASTAAATPLPTAAATPLPTTEATTSIPEALQSAWIGPARDIPALGGPLAMSIMRIRGARLDFVVGGKGEEALNSTVSVSAPGQVTFTSMNTSGGCRVGDEGTYGWSVAADGASLTVTKVAEACPPRAEAAVGAWVRAACKDFGCLGDLAAGPHLSAFLEPTGNPSAFSATWRMQYGGLSYSVPDGWANAIDDPNFYSLVRQDAYATTVADATRYPGIIILPGVAMAAQDEACSPKVQPGVGRSPRQLAARIARIPSLETGVATPISVAGRSGTMLDIALRKGWSRFCAAGGGVPMLRQGGTATNGLGGWDRRLGETERWRLILLDVAEGRTLAILIDSIGDPSRFDDLVGQAMPIVATFALHRPAP